MKRVWSLAAVAAMVVGASANAQEDIIPKKQVSQPELQHQELQPQQFALVNINGQWKHCKITFTPVSEQETLNFYRKPDINTNTIGMNQQTWFLTNRDQNGTITYYNVGTGQQTCSNCNVQQTATTFAQPTTAIYSGGCGYSDSGTFHSGKRGKRGRRGCR